MKRFFLLLLLSLFFKISFSQSVKKTYDFHPPVDIPMILSGNFAELRSNHFHSGIDIKTQGRTGINIYAIDEGYVSRIKVQANGYGKAIYINHPSGFTSVYGHLENYGDRIEDYVKQYQYRHQSHEVDIYPDNSDLPVEKGMIVGYSGNSGSSSGPHLHFEIRTSARQYPQNVLKFGFDIEDNIAPRPYSLFVYEFEEQEQYRRPVNRKEIELINKGGYYTINNEMIYASTSTGFGIEAYDFLNGAWNKCGIHKLELYVNEKPFFRFQSDEFSFSESRYINAYIDYSLKELTGRKVQNLFIKPHTNLSMYHKSGQTGLLHPKNDEIYDIRILLTDVQKNSTEIRFKLNGKIKEQNNHNEDPGKEIWNWDEPNAFSSEMVKLHVPANSLYENAPFLYSLSINNKPIYPYVHHINSPEIPLHKSSHLSLNVKNIPIHLHGKIAIVKKLKNGRSSYKGGKVNQGWITANIREFGEYSIEVDTIAPEIKAKNIYRGKNMREAKSIRFDVRDEVSGIAEYKGFIDNKWVLFEYDPKNDLLVYYFDDKRLLQNTQHELKLVLKDHFENQKEYHTAFYW